jgi:hypothetical protein
MENNWPVVYNAGKPWNGPGPFQRHIELEGANALGWNALDCHFAGDGRGQVGVQFGLQQQREYARLGVKDATAFVAKAIIGKAILAGPKLFRPTARQSEPLEQVELSVRVADYRQPFPTCVVEFPDDYATIRLIPAAVAGSMFVRPGFAVAHQENGVIVVALVYPPVCGHEGYYSCHMGLATGVIEEILLEYATISDGHTTPPPGLYSEGGPSEWFIPFVRVALNFLMLAAGGHRLIGPANPAQAKTLRERIKRAKKGRQKDKLKDLRNRLRHLPSVYALAQEIKLFDREQPPTDPNPDADGTPKTPHWRKGHWRLMAVGVGRTERKRVFIKPVLVNGHLLPE